MTRLTVSLADRSYPVIVASDLLSDPGQASNLDSLGERFFVLSDQVVSRLHAAKLLKLLEQTGKPIDTLTVSPGETAKSLARVDEVITKMLELGCDRDCCVVTFGGGVVGDLGGFVASIFKRGAPLVQVPTTLLAQVDASVGGKTAVNHQLGKNLIGTFYQPRAVLSDLSLLSTLPERQVLCGLGEVIKHGIIKDDNLFGYIEKNIEGILALEPEHLEHLVIRSCEIKAEIVAADERDIGERLILNFGHTLGHALEACMGYESITHGEAVLLGMIAEAKIAVEVGLFATAELERMCKLILGLNMNVSLDTLDEARFFKALSHDKKRVAGKDRLVLPSRIGEVGIHEGISDQALRSGLRFMLSKIQ